jgi:hypothetical protein
LPRLGFSGEAGGGLVSNAALIAASKSMGSFSESLRSGSFRFGFPSGSLKA